MNLDDLRAELDARANDLDTHASGRMSGIRAKIAQRRRRKAGATAAASVLAVGAIIGVPVVSHLSAGPEPAKQAPFPEKIDGDTRIASTMGDEGDTKVTLKFTPEDTDFLLKIDCDGVAPGVAHARVNGRRTSAVCGSASSGVSSGEVGGVASSANVRRLWERMGVRAGEPVTITVRATDLALKPTQSTRGTLGVAVYAMTGERRDVLGVALPEQKTVDGETYALADDGYTVAPTRPKGTQRVYVPESDKPTLVTYGSPDRGAVTRVTIDGAQETTGGVSYELLPSGGARTVRARNLSDDKRARLVIAHYTPSDDDEEADNEDDADRAQMSFPDTTDARDPIVDSTVGERGETELRATFNSESTNLELRVACHYSGRYTWRGIRLAVSVNGAKVGTAPCRPESTFKLGDLADEIPNAQTDHTWNVTVQVSTRERSGIVKSNVTLGAALYECSADRVEVNGFLLPREYRHDGDWYELADSESVDVGPGVRRATLRRDASDEPIVVASAFVEPTKGWGQTWVDGKRIGYSLESDELRFKVAAGSSQRLVSEAIGRYEGGRLLIAYYLPEE